MCEAYPGPRCSPEMRTKMDTRFQKLTETINQYGEHSYQTVKAEAYYIAARNHYDATPKGLEELKTLIETNIDDPTLLERYLTGLNTRKMQQNAVLEVKNGRINHLTNIYSQTQTFYSEEETATIINASREYEETLVLKSPTNIVGSTSEKKYETFIHSLENNLNIYYKGNIPEDIKTSLYELKSLPAPDKINFKAYITLNAKLEASRKQLNNEIGKIAALHNVSPRVAASFFDSYRQQYLMVFSHLPEAERPDPPEKWVKGEIGSGSFTKNINSCFIPSDPATLYAVYRLRSDPNSVPDYLKTRKNFASVSFTRLNDTETLINAAVFAPNGVKLKTYTQTTSNQPNSLQGHTAVGWGNVKPELVKLLENKTVISDDMKTTVEVLKTHLNQDFLSTLQSVDIVDVCKKQYDMPHITMNAIKNETFTDKSKTTEDDKSVLNGEIFFRTLKNANNMWKQKPSRKNAPAIDSIAPSRWGK